jgi:hypothetical protein
LGYLLSLPAYNLAHIEPKTIFSRIFDMAAQTPAIDFSQKMTDAQLTDCTRRVFQKLGINYTGSTLDVRCVFLTGENDAARVTQVAAFIHQQTGIRGSALKKARNALLKAGAIIGRRPGSILVVARSNETSEPVEQFIATMMGINIKDVGEIDVTTRQITNFGLIQKIARQILLENAPKGNPTHIQKMNEKVRQATLAAQEAFIEMGGNKATVELSNALLFLNMLRSGGPIPASLYGNMPWRSVNTIISRLMYGIETDTTEARELFADFPKPLAIRKPPVHTAPLSLEQLWSGLSRITDSLLETHFDGSVARKKPVFQAAGGLITNRTPHSALTTPPTLDERQAMALVLIMTSHALEGIKMIAPNMVDRLEEAQLDSGELTKPVSTRAAAVIQHSKAGLS